jgi:hypothetical protein
LSTNARQPSRDAVSQKKFEKISEKKSVAGKKKVSQEKKKCHEKRKKMGN